MTTAATAETKPAAPPTPTAAATPAATPAADVTTTTDADDEQADRDFDSGFTAATTGEEPAAPATPPKPAAEATPKQPERKGKAKPPPASPATPPTTATAPATPPAPAAASAPAAPPETLHFGLTEAQVKAALAKASEVDDVRAELTKVRRELGGTLGTVQQALKELRAAPTPAQAVKISKDLFKKLNAAGLEDIADALAEDLNGLVMASSAPAFDQAAYDKTVDEKVAKMRTDLARDLPRDMEKKILTIVHPDWVEVYASNDFKLWAGTLPADVRQEVITSWDSVFLSKALTAFKGWKANGSKPADTPAADTSAQDENTRRLEAAMDPATTGAPPSPGPSDDDAFDAGFKAARGGT